MAKQVRIKRADLPSKIDIESAEVVDMGKAEKIVKYHSYADGTIDITTSKTHKFVEGSPSNLTEIIVTKVPVARVGGKKTAYVASQGNLYIAGSGALANGSMIQFTAAPINAKKNTTYYVSDVSGSYFSIRDARNATNKIQVKATTMGTGGKASKFSFYQVLDINSPAIEKVATVSSAYTGKYKANAPVGYYDKNSRYVTYTTSTAHGYTIFDYVTITGTTKVLGSGGSSIFNCVSEKIVSVTETTFTIQIGHKLSGTAIGGASRVLAKRPFTVTTIPDSNIVQYQFVADGEPAMPLVAALSVNSGSVSLYYENIAERYYIKYVTKSPHNLVKGDIINIYDIKPSSLNINNKRVTDELSKIKLKEFVFAITFDIDKKSAQNLVYLFSQPNSPGSSEATNPITYLSGGFLNSVRYLVRYRLKSNDSNLMSKWSGVYLVENQYPEEISANLYDGGSNG